MGMSRTKFKNNLVQAITSKDYYVEDETIEKFLDLNYDEDSSLAEWEYQDFNEFALALCDAWGDIWEAAREFDLHYPDEDEEDDDRDEKPWDYGKHFN